MFQHADTHDPVIGFVQKAIVLQTQVDSVRQSLGRDPRLCRRKLVLRQRHPSDPRVILFGQRDRQTTPATADIQHLHSRLEQQLFGNVPFLGDLCVFERHLGIGEIPAAVLHVLIKEQRIKIV